MSKPGQSSLFDNISYRAYYIYLHRVYISYSYTKNIPSTFHLEYFEFADIFSFVHVSAAYVAIGRISAPYRRIFRLVEMSFLLHIFSLSLDSHCNKILFWFIFLYLQLTIYIFTIFNFWFLIPLFHFHFLFHFSFYFFFYISLVFSFIPIFTINNICT